MAALMLLYTAPLPWLMLSTTPVFSAEVSTMVIRVLLLKIV